MDGAIDVARVNQCDVLRMCPPCSGTCLYAKLGYQLAIVIWIVLLVAGELGSRTYCVMYVFVWAFA